MHPIFAHWLPRPFMKLFMRYYFMGYYKRLKRQVQCYTCLLVLLGISTQAFGASDNHEYLLSNYPESQKGQMQHIISFTTRRYPGKILGISRNMENDERYFKVKLLNPKGQVKTYYLDKTVSKISP